MCAHNLVQRYAIFLIQGKFLRFYLVICLKSSIFALEFDKNSMDL